MKTPALLAVLDGVGIAPPDAANAVTSANAPFLHELFSDTIWPFRTVEAAGRDVGLPEGQMGNSEVGHLNIGAGRIINQELTRIDLSIEDGSIELNEVLLDSFDAAIAAGVAGRAGGTDGAIAMDGASAVIAADGAGSAGRAGGAIAAGGVCGADVTCGVIAADGTDGTDSLIAAGGTVHFLGLHSDGGVHSMLTHLYALMEMAAGRGVRRIRIAAFLDGRDVSPTSGAGYVRDTVEVCRELVARFPGLDARFSMISGRYWAMDRDKRWDRVERGWRALVVPEAPDVTLVEPGADPVQIVLDSYAAGITDEFVEPVAFGSEGIADGDSIVFFNFRPDRAREITRAFIDPAFGHFERPVAPDVNYVCMTEFDATFERDFNCRVAFPKSFPTNVLADHLSSLSLRQLHIAETEKYAHVTFFFNGGVEEPKAGEQRILIPSPKVATYDLKPEMSAFEVTDALVEAIETDAADVYIVNYANGDMVGHTGVLPAAIAAIEAVDTCLHRVVNAILVNGGVALVTADHGNSEQMVDEDGSPWTAHTISPVPLTLICAEAREDDKGTVSDKGTVNLTTFHEKLSSLPSPCHLPFKRTIDLDRLGRARLADIAPTLLDLMELPIPPEFTGRSLLIRM